DEDDDVLDVGELAAAVLRLRREGGLQAFAVAARQEQGAGAGQGAFQHPPPRQIDGMIDGMTGTKPSRDDARHDRELPQTLQAYRAHCRGSLGEKAHLLTCRSVGAVPYISRAR